MEHEKLKIFNQQREQVGVATREDVHRLGLWHETFHCWLVCREDEVDYIFLQIRSSEKKDYPNLLDITAAGHILADETICDGVREIKEELGIEVDFNDLIPLGIIDYSVTKDEMIDNEIAHVFLFNSQNTFTDFRLQKEEVSGIVKAKLTDFCKLWLGEKPVITIEGFEINNSGENTLFNKNVDKKDFVSHEISYYETIIKLIQKEIKMMHG